jgi:hypothetical protein
MFAVRGLDAELITSCGCARFGMSASLPGVGCGFAEGGRNIGVRGRLSAGLAKKPSMFVARFGLKLSYFFGSITWLYYT